MFRFTESEVEEVALESLLDLDYSAPNSLDIVSIRDTLLPKLMSGKIRVPVEVE